MVALSAPLPALSTEAVSLYYNKDALLESLPVIIFYGSSTTSNTTHNSSRIQAHIYSLAGFQSFARLTVAPTSPFYAAVHHLPTEKQGDEVYRGLALCLLNYFATIPKTTKDCLKELVAHRRHNRLAPAMFDEMHAGGLAAGMVKVDDFTGTLEYVMSALSPRMLSWVDMEIKLPPGTIERAMSADGTELTPSIGEDGLPLYRYGVFDSLINSLGMSTFLPTSKLKRAPSRPTVHGKNKPLTKEQKVRIRQDLCEMLDTEQRYVEKLRELVHITARDFQRGSTGPLAENLVNQLFPGSLGRILEANTAFCEDMETVIGNTEDEAIKDIEGVLEDDVRDGNVIPKGRLRDITGVTAFAKTMMNWLPRFKVPYQDYLQSSADFPSVLNEALRSEPSISSQVQVLGEQHLRSLLIEPVQRLPRYSLLIDSMISSLPSAHSAMANLLKAKDLITDTCALDMEGFVNSTHIVSRLRNLIEDWPSSFAPKGRLITAVDVRELVPPYSELLDGQPGILLLFSDYIALLSKVANNALSARGLVAEVERPAARSNSLVADQERALVFASTFSLDGVLSSQSENGRLLWLSTCINMVSEKSNHQEPFIVPQACVKVFALHSNYEGKAARLCEEIAKARIEGRFPEAIRESDKWTLRTIAPTSDTLGVLAAVFEDGTDDSKGLSNVRSRILMDIGGTKSTKSLLSGDPNLNIAVAITTLENTKYRLDCRTTDDNTSTDTAVAEDLCLLLSKRLQHLLRSLHQSQSQGLAAAVIALHREILRAMPIHGRDDSGRGRGFRPISPVKMLSNFLGGGQPDSPSKPREHSSPIKDIPRMLPPLPSRPQSTYNKDEVFLDSQANTIQTKNTEIKSSLTLLEDTFATYAVALRSRTGNIVGRVLRGRTAADELSINELYNALLEDPTRVRAAAEVAVNVLFVAFEKFLKVAWKERMGPLLPQTLLVRMQSGLDTGRQFDFVQRFRDSLEEMTPQNKRAFTAIIKLLSDLLEGSGNDGDRGALMASFAEALILDDSPHDYITLLDRLVDDYDVLFEVTVPEDATSSVASDSLKRNRSVNTGSLSSNASSLRRKFGFGTLSRENSKSESESKVASVWRTLSKNTKSPGESHSQPGSLSKGSLLRSRSTDTDPRMLPPLRPASRDRPITSGAASYEEPSSRPGSSHRSMAILSTIGEGTPTKPAVLTKKKRRSSLSDLRPLTGSPSLSTYASSPSQLRTPTKIQLPSSALKSPSIDQSIGQKGSTRQPDASPSLAKSRFGSPERLTTPQRPSAPSRPSETLQRKVPSPKATWIASPKRTVTRHDDTVPSTPGPTKRKTSQTGIPTPKGLSERQWPPNGTTSPKKQTQSPQKLRMQSPQKLRERLSNEHKAHTMASANLQAELAAIGNELSALKRTPSKPSHIAPVRPLNIPSTKTLTTSPTKPSTPPSPDELSSRLDQLTLSLTTHTSTNISHLNSLTSEATTLTTQLDASNRKIKKLDALYKEANAENEALYERFNDELSKVLGRVKKGEGVQVLKDRVGELETEVADLRDERRVLKREAVERAEEGG